VKLGAVPNEETENGERATSLTPAADPRPMGPLKRCPFSVARCPNRRRILAHEGAIEPVIVEIQGSSHGGRAACDHSDNGQRTTLPISAVEHRPPKRDKSRVLQLSEPYCG